ncbi:T9SS type A sorting domain-containing protein [Aureisphaera sp. CAU 1614]|uniref:T9SS type A sorting domain-containing protein n=1 Tax=Halomarinibacterium sedimenti TaxID=2857106 RepID=A0A9X1FQJ9_9FLAO|nr:T9SS type A sorting domain-containing protein [Halomarinibacterium sedimenti]MBW2938953.1 T9SS type A sorting domain-containing protein [Halomarinibacterium sedimenti]
MKNLLLLLAVATIANVSYAQLYVSPNATTSTDSYVYVKDQLLFVEQDINLVLNTNNPTTVGSIYLREGSQLLQGNSNSTNSGTGHISVFQESNADSYDYNFWCSPVGRLTGSGNQNFGVRRLWDSLNVTESLRSETTGNFNSVSSPLRIATRWLYTFNPVNQRWAATGASDLVPAGYGFTMKGTDVTVHSDPYNEPQNQRYDFRGRPNNGNITIPAQTAAIPFTDGTNYYFTFTGNPYPSVLDLNLFFNDSDNQEIDAIRFWDEDRSINSHLYIDNKGGYGTWIPGPTPYVDGGVYTAPNFMNYDSQGNPTTDTGVNGASFERLYAPVGQGFMVSSNSGIVDASPNQLILKNSQRATTFIKEGAGNFSEFRNSVEATPLLRLHAIFGDNTHFRDMVLMFHNSATFDFDRGLDATHPSDGAITEAYFTINGDDPAKKKNLVIQTVPYKGGDNMFIPISFKLNQQENVKLISAEIVNPPFQNVYLYDKLNGTYLPIYPDESANENPETASILLDAGTYEGRFFITFKDKQIISDEDDEDVPIISERGITQSVDFFQNNPAKQLEVSNPDGYDIKTLNIFDMGGKLVYSESNVGNSSKLTFPTANLSDAVYLVRLSTTDNQTIVYKINVINK